MSLPLLYLPDDNPWVTLGLGTQSLIVAIVLCIATNAYHRAKLYILLLVSYIADGKQHTRRNRLTIALTFSLLPLSLLSVLLSSILSAPVYPIYTLPILLFSFPRPLVYWPRLLHRPSVSEVNEAVFYQQALYAIANSASLTMRSCYNAYNGSRILVRYQDRLALVTILEKGYNFCCIQIQGLELEETSCHSVEATAIDSMFESLHTTDQYSTQYWLNTSLLHTLAPLDITTGLVYSDAHNTLTGIIDQPTNLERFSTNLFKTLVWTIAHYVSKDTAVLANGLLHQNSRHTALSGDKHLSDISLAETATPRLTSLEYLPSSNSADSSRMIARESLTSLPRRHTCTSITGNKILPDDSSLPSDPSLPSDVPFTDSEINTCISRFPQQFMTHILTQDLLTTEQMMLVKKLIISCYMLLDMPSQQYRRTNTTPSGIYSHYHGDLSYITSINAVKWLKNNTVLYDLAIRAYRYNHCTITLAIVPLHCTITLAIVPLHCTITLAIVPLHCTITLTIVL